MNKILNNLGLCKRANKLLIGTDQVCNSLKNTKVYLMFVANDASTETIKKITYKCEYYNIPLNLEYTTIDLCNATGVKNSKVFAVIDSGFYKLLTDHNN